MLYIVLLLSHMTSFHISQVQCNMTWHRQHTSKQAAASTGSQLFLLLTILVMSRMNHESIKEKDNRQFEQTSSIEIF